MVDTYEKIRRWRALAKEVRALAKAEANYARRKHLEQVAGTYQTIAQEAEERMLHKIRYPTARTARTAVRR